MSVPRGNREFRGRGRGQAYTPRGKPTLLHRGQNSGSSGDGGRILMYEESGSGSSFGIDSQHMLPQYGAPPKSVFGTTPYGAQQPSFSRFAFESAPSVQGPTSAFAPEIQKQHRVQQQYYHMREQQMRNEPKFCVEPLPKISPTLKKIICFTANKKLAALVETDDDEQIGIARSDLEEDLRNYDGRSNVPISQCSMPFLKKRKIEYLVVPHPQFPWAPYYCTLCDFHISDIFAADAHLSTHMKEEKRLEERRTLPERLPPLTNAQLNAIEKVLVDAAVTECPPDREIKLRATASDAMDSLKKLCNNTTLNNETQRIHLSLYGSLVSGILTRTSDINISLRVEGENTKYFVDGLFTTMEQASEWSEVKVSESPTGHARLQAIFSEEKITVDWRNDEGVKMSQLLYLYNRLHEGVLPLRQIVRQWGQKCDLTTPEKLSSQHAVPPVLLDVMLIHSLQQSKRIPCIHELPNFAGTDLFNLEGETIFDVKIAMKSMPDCSIRWNLAELFLEFLLYFSKGDVKQFLIQITSTEKTLKTDTKFNKKHLNIFDPIKDRPIASLHKAFQCYFLNCFLTTYIHFRIPRIRYGNVIGTKAIVNVDLYQTAIQSPLKKKSIKGEKKDEEEQNEKPVSLNQLPVATDNKEPDEIDSSELYTSPIVIHGKTLEEMLPEHFEIDDDNVYSRRSMMCMKESRENRLIKEIWMKLSNEGLNTLYRAPDSDEEAVPTPSTTPSCPAKKRKTKRKKDNQRKIDGDKERMPKKDERENVKQEATSLQIAPQSLSIGECTAFAMCSTTDYDATGSNEASTSTSLRSIPAPIAVPKLARRALKLIKVDSAESSELSCDQSPTEEDIALEKIGHLTLELPELTAQPTKKSSGEYDESPVISVNDVTESNMLNDNGGFQNNDNDEIVLPEVLNSYGLQPTFEELYIDLKEFDLNEVTTSLAKLSENDYDYSFDSVLLTAGFKCDQHCSACDSPKHLVTECPQLKVPPILNISRTHWKKHYSGELDRIICMLFENEKISNARHKELHFVKTRLQDAIRKKLKNDFRLDAFGSSENGFGSNKSDYDVFFRYGNDNYERSSEMQIQTIINIEQALRAARFSRVMSITTAKVPIVKFAIRVESGEIEGDISYYNELALHNTQLLKRYCSWTKDETLSKLGMFIKKWAKNCEIGDASKGSLSSYAYIILLIHFLQRLPDPLLPVLQEMGEKRTIQVDGWDVYFCDDEPMPSWSQCTLSVSELFLQFLEYFAKFDWQNQVVQIRQTNKLTKIEKGWKKLMCIEDPFDLDHNLGSGISPRMFAFIMKSFVTSREVFFTLKEREGFVRSNMAAPEKALHDIVIADSHIARYGHSLFARCRASIGGAPRDRQCFKCGRIGHFSDACPVANSGFARRGGGRGGGAIGRDDRGGVKREDNRYRDARKERLMAHRESYRVANEK
ncbi:cid-1 [Pristionchus pacificus]|nr:cid-1 [Pristionchus pacificus]